MDKIRIEVSNEELFTVREGMRQLNLLVNNLESGEMEKYIFMRHGRMVAALIPINKIKDSI